MAHFSALPQVRGVRGWLRWLLLALIMLAFARLTWQLGTKNFWWDESLSLQRAEEPWLALLRGELVLKDGFTDVMTIDQHPFFSFLLQGILVRLAGSDETVLRFPAAAAATLLVPALWAFAQRLVKSGALAPTTPWWAALLAAASPFYLWYGQEARPYALWALLAVLSTYALLRALAQSPARWRDWIGYAVALVAFLATHYLAVFLLPLHGLILFQRLAQKNLRRALMGAGIIGLVGAAAAAIALWQLIRPGAGDNLDRITLRVLLPDLLNAFSLGLSVNIVDVWWLDLVFAALAAVAVLWGLRSRQAIVQGGWIAPLYVAIPVLVLLAINVVRPAYMNSRHQSLISAGFLLLVAGGLGVAAQWRRWLAPILALPLLIGMGYSTLNYFTLPQYDKDHYTDLGQFVREQLLPGDLLLLNPPSSWRIFRYYLPLDVVDQAIARGVDVAYFGAPLLRRSWDDTFAQLGEWRGKYRRIWHANSGTHPYFDPENQVEGWLEENMIRFDKRRFFSPNSILALDMYLPGAPVYEGPADDLAIQQRVDVQFGDRIHLIGYDLAPPLGDGFAVPITLYWQVSEKPDQRYKYIFRLVETSADGQAHVITANENEPYYGVAPTNYWDPGKVIIEYSNLPPAPLPGEAQLELLVQMYDAETLAKLPAILVAGAGTVVDAETIALPLPPLQTSP